MTAQYTETSTTVPIQGGNSVEIEPGQPWPSAYRGSRYSLVNNQDFEDSALKWEQLDLKLFTDPPAGLRSKLSELNKEDGHGRVQITADKEVITKIKAERYPYTEQAPVSSGWIPVYVGTLQGTISFGEVTVDPDPPEQGINVWRGLPFNHGERWSVRHDRTLVWRWRDYEFESAFDHSELTRTYDQYRTNPGRMYITEYGHVWVNLPHSDITAARQQEVATAVQEWKDAAEQSGDVSTLRLVNRRMVATSQSQNPSGGSLPIHIGHLSEFDGGVVPRPVVDDESYFQVVGQYEEVWE